MIYNLGNRVVNNYLVSLEPAAIQGFMEQDDITENRNDISRARQAIPNKRPDPIPAPSGPHPPVPIVTQGYSPFVSRHSE